MTGRMSRIGQRLRRSLIPTRESLERSRIVGPFVVRQELWRFTRRSVPRAVAIGLFVGFVMLWPPMQVVGAVLMCVPFRANIPIAALMTALSNPFTMPLIYLGSIHVGNWLGFDADLSMFNKLYESGASIGEWVDWLFSDVAPALLVGLCVISIIFSVIGYFLSAYIWRWRVGRKRRARLGQNEARRVAQL